MPFEIVNSFIKLFSIYFLGNEKPRPGISGTGLQTALLALRWHIITWRLVQVRTLWKAWHLYSLAPSTVVCLTKLLFQIFSPTPKR